MNGIGSTIVFGPKETMELESVERFDIAQIDDVTSFSVSQKEHLTAYNIQFYGKGRCRIIYERGRPKRIIGENIKIFVRKPHNILTVASTHFNDIETFDN